MPLGISALAYVGLNVSDPDRWRCFLESVFGMDVTETPDGTLRARLDDRCFRLALHAAEVDGHAYSGWEVPSDRSFDELTDRLRGQGIAVVEEPRELCEARSVRRLASLTDPTLGARFEIVLGPGRSTVPFRASRPHSGFKTGALGLGHVVFTATDPGAAAAAMIERYGFRISDYARWDGIEMSFLHCNPRHHSLAFITPLGPSCHGDLQHIMIEANQLQDVGRSYDLVEREGWPLVMTVGSHPNDDSTSFYVRTPSGFAMEYSWGGRDIGPDWTVVTHDAPHTWGHKLVI